MVFVADFHSAIIFWSKNFRNKQAKLHEGELPLWTRNSYLLRMDYSYRCGGSRAAYMNTALNEQPAQRYLYTYRRKNIRSVFALSDKWAAPSTGPPTYHCYVNSTSRRVPDSIDRSGCGLQQGRGCLCQNSLHFLQYFENHTDLRTHPVSSSLFNMLSRDCSQKFMVVSAFWGPGRLQYFRARSGINISG